MGKRKRESSIKLKEVKPLNLFTLGSGGLGKLHLIKTFHQSVSSKVAAVPWWLLWKPQVLVLSSTGVAIINVNGATVHSASGLRCHGKLFPLNSNELSKYVEIELIILGKISIVFEKEFYQMHCRLLETFNLPNLPFFESLAWS